MTPERPTLLRTLLNEGAGAALAAYAARPAPDADDDRWGGYARFALGELLPAKDLLLRAHARGCAAAGIELATVWRYLGQLESAMEALMTLPWGDLGPFDRALAHREHGACLLAAGQHREAVRALELAWRDVTALGADGEALVGPTAQLLGYAYAQLGRTAPALHYLDTAIAGTLPERRLQGLLTRALCAVHAGRYARADADLDAAQALLDATPGARAFTAYLLGTLRRAQGRWQEALSAYAAATGHARTVGEANTEFIALLGAASVHTAVGQLDDAAGALARAARLEEKPADRAHLALRRGAWEARAGRPEALGTLRGARDAWTALDFPREAAWAELHLAEAHLRQGEAAPAREALRRAALHREALGDGASLIPELHLLRELPAYLAAHADEADAQRLLADRRATDICAPLQVRLQSFGRGQVLVDGQEVRLGMRRSVELLTYVMLRESVTRDEVLLDLWPDDDPQRATNYFHQARHELNQVLPNLAIRFERERGTYGVQVEGTRLSWDVEEFQRLLSAGNDNGLMHALTLYQGPFLADATSEWVHKERTHLEWSMVKVGLQLMQRWSASGDYARCLRLSRRLLEIDPFDETLAELLVEATLQLEGRAQALHTLRGVTERFDAEQLERPPALQHMMERLSRLN